MNVIKTIDFDLVDRPGARPKVCQSCQLDPMQSAFKYVPRAAKEAEKHRKLAEEPDKIKVHRWLDLRVGDMVRVRGKVKEWLWKSRQGQVMRELQVDSEGTFIREPALKTAHA